MFHINDVVELVEDLPKEGLEKGLIGVVVAEFSDPVEAYEVEFCDESGVVMAQVSTTPDKIVKITN
nr:DUF4926 domain-containing protein [Halomonas socia]